MKYQNEKVNELVKSLDAQPIKKSSPYAPDPNQRKRMPVLKGDEFHFVFDPKKDLMKEYTRFHDTYRMVVDKNGKEISQSQLTRQGNGLELEGLTTNEALGSFFEMAIAKGDEGLKVNISDIKISPSTIEGHRGAKLFFFSVVN